MRRRRLVLAGVLLLAGCAGAPDLAQIPEVCDLPANSWMPDDDGITVITYGVAPQTRDQVQCVLDESGASQGLQNDIWVETPHQGPHKSQEERGLRYSWQWKEQGLHVIVRPA